MGAILNELNEILSDKDFVIEQTVTELMTALDMATPKDTQYLAGGWERSKLSNGTIIIDNPVEYAEIRLLPAIVGDNGKLIQGSHQFPAGIQQVIDKYERILLKRLKAIK